MESIGLLSLLLLRCCDVSASHFPPVRQSWQNGRPFIILVAPAILVKIFVLQLFFFPGWSRSTRFSGLV